MDTASILIIINIVVTLVAGPIALGIRDSLYRLKHSKCGCFDCELIEIHKNSDDNVKKD